MSERDFLMSLKAGLVPCPGDIDTVLILADWLEENGQLEKAEWIRQQVKEGGNPCFEPKVQPDLFFRFEGTGKVFRNGRSFRLDMDRFRLSKRLRQTRSFPDQARLLRGLLMASIDIGVCMPYIKKIWHQVPQATQFHVSHREPGAVHVGLQIPTSWGHNIFWYQV